MSYYDTGIICSNLHRDEVLDVAMEKRAKRHVLTVGEVLQFPDEYHTRGVLSLPYGDIVEPFEAWYSKRKKMSRIDYYNGEDQYKSTGIHESERPSVQRY